MSILITFGPRPRHPAHYWARAVPIEHLPRPPVPQPSAPRTRDPASAGLPRNALTTPWQQKYDDLERFANIIAEYPRNRMKTNPCPPTTGHWVRDTLGGVGGRIGGR
jgi:hypothetical protein